MSSSSPSNSARDSGIAHFSSLNWRIDVSQTTRSSDQPSAFIRINTELKSDTNKKSQPILFQLNSSQIGEICQQFDQIDKQINKISQTN